MSSPTRARIAALGLFVANVAYMVGVFTPMIGPDADGPFNLAPLLATPLLLAPFGLLMLRPTDRHAWLLALMCSGFFVFIGGLPVGLPPDIALVMAIYRYLVMTMAPALFSYLFLVFPARTSLDTRVPQLKWGIVAAGIILVLTSDVWRLLLGTPLLQSADNALGLPGVLGGLRRVLDFFYIAGAFGVGLFALIWNATRSPLPGVRCKMSVLATGTALTIVPWVGIVLLEVLRVVPPLWLQVVGALSTPFMPAAFAYAVVRHRVMAIPVLLRHSVRYLLVQRGLAIASVLASVVVAVTLVGLVQQLLPEESEFGVPGAVVFAVLTGVGLARTGTRVERRVTSRIDRLFFRERYDARNVLEALVERADTAEGREDLAGMLETELLAALHPESIAIYLEDGQGGLPGAVATSVSGVAPPRLDPQAALWAPLTAGRKPVILQETEPVPGEVDSGDDLDARLAASLQPLEIECVAPLVGRRDGRLVGLIALGPRRSEEPYSREDLQLIDAIADHAALTLDNISLSEEMADRIEVQRRADREISFAQEVQRQLLPDTAPELPGFVYAAHCVQAKSVGGDYYDFIPTGPGGVTLVLADVAGKGIAAALLMANLQATLRSQHALTRDDPVDLLGRVNQQFFASTPGNRYATLFLANFDQASGRLLYVNCGHVSPRIARAEGTLDKLGTTGWVMGMFESWVGESASTTLHPGDTLVVCSDGVPEAMNAADEVFGDERFDAALRENAHLPVPELITAIETSVQAFAGDLRSDDLTLLVARVTERSEHATDGTLSS